MTGGRDTDERRVEIPVGPGLAADLAVPAHAIGVALFAHGSGSSRLSPRNRFVAEALHRRRIATLLLDLLTEDEERDRANVFDVDLLGDRLAQTALWLRAQPVAGDLRPCFFGASTGAAAALIAAARLGADVRAVVSRGGRPDLAAAVLPLVVSPTLLVVGGADRQVLELNREALARLACEKRLEVVPGAGHLFEEPGALGQVAELAAGWLEAHLTPAARPA